MYEMRKTDIPMNEIHELPEVKPGTKVVLNDGRTVAVHDRMADLIFVKTGEQRWETHISEVDKIDETDAFEPEEAWF